MQLQINTNPTRTPAGDGLLFADGSDAKWPPSDLSDCDFFLWGTPRVFNKHRPHTLEELKEGISKEVTAVYTRVDKRLKTAAGNRLELVHSR